MKKRLVSAIDVLRRDPRYGQAVTRAFAPFYPVLCLTFILLAIHSESGVRRLGFSFAGLALLLTSLKFTARLGFLKGGWWGPIELVAGITGICLVVFPWPWNLLAWLTAVEMVYFAARLQAIKERDALSLGPGHDESESERVESPWVD